MYEKSRNSIDAQRSNPRGTDNLRQKCPICQNWDKNSGNVADSGGSADGVSFGSSWDIQRKFKQLDTCRKQKWIKRIRVETTDWPTR